MFIWNTSDGSKCTPEVLHISLPHFLPDLASTIEFDKGFTATSVLHPATYLNKVLVASSQGDMQLWNIQSKQCIYKYESTQLISAPATPLLGQKHQPGSAIICMTQSPAIDVVGLGFASGEISVYDVRADERLMRMFMEGGSVRSLGFRTGTSSLTLRGMFEANVRLDGHPILASASSAGHIALWDLNSGGRLLHMIRGAHDGAVTHVEWVPGQPLLISSGEDNSVKVSLTGLPSGGTPDEVCMM